VLSILEFITVIFGMCTVALSVYLGFYFNKVNLHLSRALAIMLWGEAIGGAVATVFAITSMIHIYPISPWFLISMRWIIFLSASLSSLHLLWAVINIKRRNKKIKNKG
jgi:hypothetical protein